MMKIPCPAREYVVPLASKFGVSPPPVARVARRAGGFIHAPNGVLMPVYCKGVADCLEYTFHWDLHLADDDDLAGVEHTLVSPWVVVSEECAESTTQVVVEGGEPGVQVMQIRLTTTQGRQQDFVCYFVGVGEAL